MKKKALIVFFAISLNLVSNQAKAINLDEIKEKVSNLINKIKTNAHKLQKAGPKAVNGCNSSIRTIIKNVNYLKSNILQLESLKDKAIKLKDDAKIVISDFKKQEFIEGFKKVGEIIKDVEKILDQQSSIYKSINAVSIIAYEGAEIIDKVNMIVQSLCDMGLLQKEVEVNLNTISTNLKNSSHELENIKHLLEKNEILNAINNLVRKANALIQVTERTMKNLRF